MAVEWRIDDDTLARFESEQFDLASLCEDRALATSEIFKPNDYYGGAQILKKYAGLAADRSLHAVIPHGVYLSDTWMWSDERASLLPAALVFPAYREAVYRQQGKMAIPSAAPFVYANLMVPEPFHRAGTIFFPVHSTHRLSAEIDHDGLAERLTGFPQHLGPVSVMLYWRDYNMGAAEAYVSRGLRVISAGHMYDPHFLPRQAFLLKQHAHAVSNGMGSHIFYAVKAGCSVSLVDDEYTYSGDEAHLRDDSPSLSAERQAEVDRMKSVFEFPQEKVTDVQMALAEYYLGAVHGRAPGELSDLFVWLEKVDRFGGIALLVDAGRRFCPDIAVRSVIFPRSVRRALHSVLRRIELAMRAGVEQTIRITRSVFPGLRDVSFRHRDD